MFEDEGNAPAPEQLPLYRKGREILELTIKIIDLVPEENAAQTALKEFMLVDAALLTAKVAGAEAADLYDLRMENAALIRKAARDLLSHCTGLELFGFRETHYLYLIREAVEAYRLLFIDWVQGFDPWNSVTDNWGLFNPPGIKPGEADPDDL
ncbi:hypothetical protein [Pontibacter chitinilyticus]|uniref:hypothetical protein n=1 Tax=Pontibacter chitinilyticus TaxID=2674989 RepID=UPI00321BB29C